MVEVFSSTLTLRRFTRDLPRATVQSTFTKQFRILSNATSIHTRSAGAIFQLNTKNPLSNNTQCMALGYPLFYVVLHGYSLWRHGCHSGAVGVVSLGGDWRLFEEMHYSYSHESSRRSRILHSFIPNLIRNGAKHASNYAAESSWITFAMIQFLAPCVIHLSVHCIALCTVLFDREVLCITRCHSPVTQVFIMSERSYWTSCLNNWVYIVRPLNFMKLKI